MVQWVFGWIKLISKIVEKLVWLFLAEIIISAGDNVTKDKLF